MSYDNPIPKYLLNKTRVIAIDLEGTLVSNAASQFPRPGIAEFMEFCQKHFTDILIFSAVRPQKVRQVLMNLVGREDVPKWVGELPIVPWALHPDTYTPGFFKLTDPRYKDLRYVQEIRDNAQLDYIWLLDDDGEWVAPGQESQWLPIEPWDYKNPVLDMELLRIQIHIEENLLPNF